MKSLRHGSGWLAGSSLLLVPAVFVGCASPPVQGEKRDDDGRVQLGGSSLEHRNYDGRVAHNARQRLGDSLVQPRFAGRFAAKDIAATFDETTGVTASLKRRTTFLTDKNAGTPRQVANNFAQTHTGELGLDPADLNDMEITDVVYSKITGITNVYYRQRVLGLPVYNGQLHINVADDGRILSVNNAFVPNIASLAASASPAIGADLAVASVAANLSVELLKAPAVTGSLVGTKKENLTRVEAPELSKAPIDAELMWLPVNGKHLALVWRFQVQTTDSEHWFDYTVDANTGEVWTRFDWVAADAYRVYPEPVESPQHTTPLPPADARVLRVNPANPAASPLAWQNDGTTSFLIHRGNNVHSYDDRDANNQPPANEPQCAAGNICDFPLDLTQGPQAYTPAAITNLFYWNNLIHDVTWHYGFDELNGNFQTNNFNNGGLGNDSVQAEAQDGTGTNNANFGTPPDGQRPRMQMFEWTTATPRRDGDLDSGIIMHEYGHGVSNRLVGGPANVSCLGNAQQGGEGWSDWLGLWFTALATDVGTNARGIGTYALNQPVTGPGIRTQRYSTNPTVNTWTYASIQGMAIPHGVGSVWAQVAWEMYWSLVDEHGYSSNLYDAAGTAGNQRAMLYIIQGLKATRCSPTFVDARDGILAAATAAHGGEDVCRIWEVFANYGIGIDAVSNGPASTSPVNGFALPPECICNPQPVADAGPDATICAGESITLGAPAQPDTTYLWLPGGETTAQITVSPTTTTTYTLTATTACGNESDSVTVTVGSGGSGFLADFESGSAGWSATGLWHLTSNSTCASPGSSSGVGAFYYGRDAGCNYNTGTANSGTLTSPAIQGITSETTLSFDYFRRVEAATGSFDRASVEVIRSDGSTLPVFAKDSRNPSTGSWTNTGLISLGRFAGDAIRLRFTFNTVDNVSNAFTGWLIDDVVVTSGQGCVSGSLQPRIVRLAEPAVFGPELVSYRSLQSHKE